MIVVCLTDCPPKLRGDLTKWLQEIDVGVYAGNTSARVRDALWKRIEDTCKSGRATMVFTARNEMGMDFRTHNADWLPIDFDGLKLLLRPISLKKPGIQHNRAEASKASHNHAARHYGKKNTDKASALQTFLVINMYTTGPSEVTDSVASLFVYKISLHKVVGKIAFNFTEETPITTTSQNHMIHPVSTTIPNAEDMHMLQENWLHFIQYTEGMTVVSHDPETLYRFIRTACVRLSLPMFANPHLDTLALARKLYPDMDDYDFKSVLSYFGLHSGEEEHLRPMTPESSMADTKVPLDATLYYKLIESPQETSV